MIEAFYERMIDELKTNGITYHPIQFGDKDKILSAFGKWIELGFSLQDIASWFEITTMIFTDKRIHVLPTAHINWATKENKK